MGLILPFSEMGKDIVHGPPLGGRNLCSNEMGKDVAHSPSVGFATSVDNIQSPHSLVLLTSQLQFWALINWAENSEAQNSVKK